MWSVARSNRLHDLLPQGSECRMSGLGSHKFKSHIWPFRSAVAEPAGKSYMKELQNEGSETFVSLEQKAHLKSSGPYLARGAKLSIQRVVMILIFIPDEYLSHNLQQPCSSLATELLAITLCWTLCQKVRRTFILSFQCHFFCVLKQHLQFLACLALYRFIRNQLSKLSAQAACHEVTTSVLSASVGLSLSPTQWLEPLLMWKWRWIKHYDDLEAPVKICATLFASTNSKFSIHLNNFNYFTALNSILV